MVKNNERGGGGKCRSEIGKNPLSATYYARTADRVCQAYCAITIVDWILDSFGRITWP